VRRPGILRACLGRGAFELPARHAAAAQLDAHRVAAAVVPAEDFGVVADLLRDSLLKIHERGGFPADGDEDVPVGVSSVRGGFHRDNAGKVSLAFQWRTVWAAMLAADPSLTEADGRKFRRRAKDAGASLASKVVWAEGRSVRLILLDRTGFDLIAAMAIE